MTAYFSSLGQIILPMWTYMADTLNAPFPSPLHLQSPVFPINGQRDSPKVKKTLSIISHDRHSALEPPPDLRYDLRCVPNPPMKVRETQTGLSGEVREGLLQEPRFCHLLEKADNEIRGAMKVADEKAGEYDEMVVRVGCLCGSGHHRSVAFAEKLAQMDLPEDWSLELNHRDLTPEVIERKSREREKNR
ncbi:hypothetical protein M426DRAFT_14203 [Hypoxylon sp. CI-4A]|nr:hypothetical protein M426DRAFT_14203 [Hypoxylon sp. CI-4A]